MIRLTISSSNRKRRRRKRRKSGGGPAWLTGGKLSLLLLLILNNLWLVSALRCYTDVLATKSESVECGLNTGCVKIYIDSEEMLMNQQRNYGYPPGFGEMPKLPKKYQGDPVLLRGCFVLAVPDRCYNAQNGLSYCWCSQKDLCNAARPRPRGNRTLLVALVTLSTVVGVIMFSGRTTTLL